MIRVILEILFFIFLFRLIINFILPMVLSFFVSNTSSGSSSKQTFRKPNGKIKIDYMPPKAKSTTNPKAGEFVDYEEIK